MTLIGGDPGIGKSTLMLQAAAALNAAGPVLYATGEESLKQVALRARRLGLAAATARLIAETRSRRSSARAETPNARVLIVDSIQTMYSERIECGAGRGLPAARMHGRIGALRQGRAAPPCCWSATSPRRGRSPGPRVLEHMVDTVLYFESDTGSRFRVLRSVKNRFGAANEIGVFAMVEQGLREVTNPSAIFLVAPSPSRSRAASSP